MTIVHHVLFRFKSGVDEKKINEIFEKLKMFSQTFNGISSFLASKYDSPEKLNDGFTHHFKMTFKSERDRNRYLEDAKHEGIKKEILPYLEKIIAYDYSNDAKIQQWKQGFYGSTLKNKEFSSNNDQQPIWDGRPPCLCAKL